jgi:hypothetical protein
VAASEEIVDGEGLEFRTPKGEVSFDTVKSSEPVKSPVIDKDCSKPKASFKDGTSILNELELTCVVFMIRPP